MNNYYDNIKNKLIDNEITKKVKNYSINRSDLNTYYEVGKLLSEAGKQYGENIVGEYAKRLVVDVGKKFNKRTLYRMKQFYIIFSNIKVSTTWTQLTWSHCRCLLSFNEVDKINYYIEQIFKRNLSYRQLESIIKSKEYERLPEETKNKLIDKEDNITVCAYVKDPIVINNYNNYEIISEKVLQKIVLEDIPSFLDELGEGFTFIKNEYKIKYDNTYNYIDLLFNKI